MKKSIIGGRYYCLDGSYSSCLTFPGKEAPRSAPMNNFKLTPLEIILGPFQMQPSGRKGGPLPFILTKDEGGHIYCVIYEERGLITKDNTFDMIEDSMQGRRNNGFIYDPNAWGR